MKKSELVFSAVMVPVDYFTVVLAGIFAYNLRFVEFFTDIKPIVTEIVFSQYIKFVFVVPFVFLLIFAMSGLYTIRNTRRLLDEVTSIFIASTASIAIVIIFIFFQRELFSSRFIILSAWVLSFVFVTAGRLIVRAVQRSLLKRDIGLHNVILIGDDKTTDDIAKQIYQRPSLGYRIIARFPSFTEDAKKELDSRVQTEVFDELIQADTSLTKDEVLEMRNFCNDHHLTYKYATDLFEVQPTHIEINTVAGIPIIEVKRTKLDGWGRIIKRTFDIFCASFLLFVLSPLLILVSLFVMIDSSGGILVKLERIGEKGKEFTLYKFRSMVKNAHQMKKDLVDKNERADGPLFKIKNDPRVTRVGRFIRKTSLDEFPQLINVIRGEISLVGPRPHEPEEVSRYERWHKKLLTIKPGITGLAQISGRSDLKFEDEAKLDIYYIENWSFKLDLQILFKTPWVVLRGRSAS